MEFSEYIGFPEKISTFGVDSHDVGIYFTKIFIFNSNLPKVNNLFPQFFLRIVTYLPHCAIIIVLFQNFSLDRSTLTSLISVQGDKLFKKNKYTGRKSSSITYRYYFFTENMQFHTYKALKVKINKRTAL